MMNCEDARRALVKSTDEDARHHLRGCEACVDAVVLDALGAAPEIAVPAEFAARTSAIMPAPVRAPQWSHPGVPAAVALLLVVVAATIGLAGPERIVGRLDTLQSASLAILIGFELAALVLWLGRATRV